MAFKVSKLDSTSVKVSKLSVASIKKPELRANAMLNTVSGASYFSRIDTVNPVDNSVAPTEVDVIFGGSGFPVSGNSTIYIGTVVDTSEAAVRMPMPEVTMTELYVACSVAPGSGQTFTYTVMKDGVETSLSAIISGSGTEASASSPSVAFNATNKFSLRVVTSSGAEVAYHTYSIRIQ